MRFPLYASGFLAVALSIISITAGARGDEFWSQWNGYTAIANAMVFVWEIVDPRQP